SGTVRARAFQRHPPAELLARANRTLKRRGVEGIYCTLTFALFDFTSRSMRIANSGLPYALHYRAATGTCAPIELPGLPLGIFDEVTYAELPLDLVPGDVFVFHSDGISEAHNGREAYGMNRLKKLVDDGAAQPRLGERILEDLEKFMGDR